ncbi:MAG: hypothetical protein AAFQ89_04735 [Cyanobacteria bacterium J06626_18]
MISSMGDGDDLINGGRGANTLTGGSGADILGFESFDGALDRIT